MKTLNLSDIYADRDGYDECMRAGSLKTSLPARLYIYMYYLYTTTFMINFYFLWAQLCLILPCLIDFACA